MAEINWRCGWCGVRQSLFRALMRRRYCADCNTRIGGSAGIYLQAGGPPCPQMGRADDHHAPMALLTAKDQPPRPGWLIQMLCQHCPHLAPKSGSFCCECGVDFIGLPLGGCRVCDVGGQLR